MLYGLFCTILVTDKIVTLIFRGKSILTKTVIISVKLLLFVTIAANSRVMKGPLKNSGYVYKSK